MRAASALRITALLVSAAGLLSACATRPQMPEQSLSGRLFVQIDGQPERSQSADFDLTGSARQGRLLLTGPLGTGAAQAQWSPAEAWLLINGGRTRYADLDALSAAVLGEPVPMAALFDWLRGQPWPGAASSSRADGGAGFEQLGWRIDLSRWSEAWIEARREAPPIVSLRARLERP